VIDTVLENEKAKMMLEGFILTSNQIIADNQTRLVFQGRLSDGRRFHWTIIRPGIVFFINHDESWTPPGAVRKEVKLCNMRGKPVDALYFRNTQALNQARKACETRNISTFEADVNLVARFLMERFIKGAVIFKSDPIRTGNNTLYFVDPVVKPSDHLPALKLLSMDIECSMGMDLYSIALFGTDLEIVLMVDENREQQSNTDAYQGFKNEKELLLSFFNRVREYDPDALIGWNLIGFDLQWLARKCQLLGIRFDIGCDGLAQILSPGKLYNQWSARIPGMAALDGITVLRSAYVQTEGYSLAAVAEKVLGSKKLIETTGLEKVAEITRLFKEDKKHLAKYNLQDTRLVYEIFEKLNLSQLVLRRSQLTGLPLDRVGGSVAAFDFLYLPHLHRYGYVADTDPKPPADAQSAPGGLVFDSTPGFYHNVAVLDFKSLYPSIILSFSIDPLAANICLHALTDDRKTHPDGSGKIIKGPAGLEFAADYAILPSIIQELWQAREMAKKSNDSTLSQAVKIIMNSFYGVLGSTGCRFYDPRLAGSITRIGHWILNVSRQFIENEGYGVIYGDTDSLFVNLGKDNHQASLEIAGGLSIKLNRYLAKELEQRFKVSSKLEVEFEKLFVRFFMPTIRGQNTGSKKRYAGFVLNQDGATDLVFTGMESNRRDWTDIAKEFQTALFTILFHQDETPGLEEKLIELVRSRHKALYDGKLDDRLVYRKGISKRLKDYTKNAPPHVRAARMLDRLDGRIVRYVITTAGPEPIQKRSDKPYDYDHYSQKQLAPVADMVLRFFDMDYRSIIRNERQLRLF
jgi:DNA polymerase II